MNANPQKRLSVADVKRLERLLGGDPVTEAMVIGFIGEKYAAKNLFYVPHKVAGEIFKRPNDFLRAVKKHCEPELGF
ncbi:MAG: hypothetical protein ACXWKG_12765 [Limisphaerales bacterium]